MLEQEGRGGEEHRSNGTGSEAVREGSGGEKNRNYGTGPVD